MNRKDRLRIQVGRFLKMNAIAYVDANENKYGGFIYLGKGDFREFVFENKDSVHNNEEKAITHVAGLNNFEKITIFSDSTVAIKRCSQKESFRNVSMVFIPRCFNRIADKILK